MKVTIPYFSHSYHTSDIWERDEWEDIAKYLECSEREDISNYRSVVVNGVFYTVEHGFMMGFFQRYSQ